MVRGDERRGYITTLDRFENIPELWTLNSRIRYLFSRGRFIDFWNKMLEWRNNEMKLKWNWRDWLQHKNEFYRTKWNDMIWYEKMTWNQMKSKQNKWEDIKGNRTKWNDEEQNEGFSVLDPLWHDCSHFITEQ